ncbi:MAG: DMT family transporter [Gemmatimonadaceae bacterium]
MPSLALSGIAWILIAETLFALMRVATRVNAGALPWPAVAAVRFIGGGVVVALVATLWRSSLRVNDRRATWLRSVFGSGSALGVFYSLGSRSIAVGDAATLSATAPLFVALLSAPMLGERVTRRTALGVALGFVGVVVLVGPSFRSAAAPALAALAGAFSYAFALIFLRRIGPNESGEAVALHVSLVSGTLMLALAVLGVGHASSTAAPAARPPALSLPALAGAATAGGLAQIAITRAYAAERAARLGAVSYAGVALTYAMELALLRRLPSAPQLAGAALIVTAGVMVAAERGAAAVPAEAGE